MKKSHKAVAMGGVGISLFIVLAIFVGLFPLMTKSNTQSNWSNTITIDTPYAFATPTGAKTAAAFMVIKNGTEMNERLISVSSDIAEVTEIHQTILDPDDGKMMMRKINGLDIPAGKKVGLDPKGYHIMFLNLNKPLNEADYFKLFLNFEKTGTHEASVFVVPAGGVQKDAHAEHDHHGHDH